MKNNLYKIIAHIAANDGPEVFQTGTVYARAQTIKAARKLAATHVDQTWTASDPRVDFKIKIENVERLSAEESAAARFNRPEMVWTEDDKPIASPESIAAAAPELLAILEWITRCPKVPARLTIGNYYAISDEKMTEARALVASLANPKTYLARQRAKEAPGPVFALVQQGGGTKEFYLHVCQTMSEAEENKAGCERETYRASEIFEIPGAVANEKTYTAIETAITAAVSLI